LELDLPAALEIFGALSRIDGSVGWIAMIGAGCDIFAPWLPRETYEQVYQNGPDVIIAGSAQPAGTAEAAAGGWRVNGQWPFASGCQHADWMFGLCVITENGKPLPGPAGEGGPPLIRGVFLPARDWQIEDTWYVAGLKGTGSHHIVLRDTLVTGDEFLRSLERSTVPAGAAVSSRAAIPSVDAWRQLARYSRGSFRRTGRACQYRQEAAAGRCADAGFGNIPSRTRPYRSRIKGGTGLSRGPGSKLGR
jgi:alkylation response protein AidB-like acyl-CoA dehydrogenase